MITSVNKCSPVESEWSTSSVHKSVRNTTVQTASLGSWETAAMRLSNDTKRICGLDDGTIRFFKFDQKLLLAAFIMRRVWKRIIAVVFDNYLNRQ